MALSSHWQLSGLAITGDYSQHSTEPQLMTFGDEDSICAEAKNDNLIEWKRTEEIADTCFKNQDNLFPVHTLPAFTDLYPFWQFCGNENQSRHGDSASNFADLHTTWTYGNNDSRPTHDSKAKNGEMKPNVGQDIHLAALTNIKRERPRTTRATLCGGKKRGPSPKKRKSRWVRNASKQIKEAVIAIRFSDEYGCFMSADTVGRRLGIPGRTLRRYTRQSVCDSNSSFYLPNKPPDAKATVEKVWAMIDPNPVAKRYKRRRAIL